MVDLQGLKGNRHRPCFEEGSLDVGEAVEQRPGSCPAHVLLDQVTYSQSPPRELLRAEAALLTNHGLAFLRKDSLEMTQNRARKTSATPRSPFLS